MPWIYILGETAGADMKIGLTRKPTVNERLGGVNGEQTTDASYILLAAVVGQGKDEAALKRCFRDLRRDDKGSHTEYFYPGTELVEYTAWLRAQWWTATTGTEDAKAHIVQDADQWLPQPDRRYEQPAGDQTKLVQDYEVAPGALPGPWAWMPNPQASFQDYFTPPHIVEAAREAMGGIDLDAASHWAANKVHQIPQYFDATRSAFAHEWLERVWLNPPYGDNEPWFREALHQLDAGNTTQLCMLSPVWAFTTGLATPFMARSSAMVLLTPTPKFWGNAEGRQGVNHPHAIVYVGERPVAFMRAFADLGTGMSLDPTPTDDERPATPSRATGR